MCLGCLFVMFTASFPVWGSSLSRRSRIGLGAFDNWFWPLLGVIFAPYTNLLMLVDVSTVGDIAFWAAGCSSVSVYCSTSAWYRRCQSRQRRRWQYGGKRHPKRCRHGTTRQVSQGCGRKRRSRRTASARADARGVSSVQPHSPVRNPRGVTRPHPSTIDDACRGTVPSPAGCCHLKSCSEDVQHGRRCRRSPS
jgi:hypothetical protein